MSPNVPIQDQLRQLVQEAQAKGRKQGLREAADEVASFPGGDFREIADHLRELAHRTEAKP
jgi:hypothetical protein